MLFPLLTRWVLVLALVGTSTPQMVPQTTRAPLAPQWGGAVTPGFPGYQGFRGQGYPGGDTGYGFQIIDAPDRYGYVSTYPGGRTSFFLLGPNRGPGQQSWRGPTMGAAGGSQLGTYRPGTYRPGAFRPTYRPEAFPPAINTNSLGG